MAPGPSCWPGRRPMPTRPGELDWLVAVDSTIVRVHQHGATARRIGGNAPTALAEGRSAGG